MTAHPEIVNPGDLLTQANEFNQIAKQAVAQAHDPGERPPIEVPPETSYELPGGFSILGEAPVKEFEVRELTGEDEEFLYRPANLKNAPLFLQEIVRRGLVRLGDRKPDESALDGLLAGDCEYIALAVRIATYGPDLEFSGIICPTLSCGAKMDIKYNLIDDLPVRKLTGSAYFEVTLKKGKAMVNLPTIAANKNLSEASEGRNVAEFETALLAQCVKEINGSPVLGEAPVRRMGLADRKKILRELGDRNPGPRYEDVKQPCFNCGKEFPLSFDIFSLFR